MTHLDPPARRNSLALITIERPGNAGGFLEDKAKKIPRLREPQPQLEFVIDGTSLQQLLQNLPVPEPEIYGFPEPFDLISVVDLAWPGHAASDLRRLVGDLPRDDAMWPLEPGRLPL